jgi:hypothetical protein
MHQQTRIITATTRPGIDVYYDIPRNINATDALEIDKKDMTKNNVLRIFEILKAVSTLVCSFKYLYVKYGTADMIIRMPVYGTRTKFLYEHAN